MSENWRQSEICIVINDKSQGTGTTAKHLNYDGLLHYKFTIQFAVEKNCENQLTFGEVMGKI